MVLNTTNLLEQNQQISRKKSLFHFVERHLSDLRHSSILDFMHAQNGDMSVLPSHYATSKKIERATLMPK